MDAGDICLGVLRGLRRAGNLRLVISVNELGEQIALGKLFDWRTALVIVKPARFIKWHRTMFRAFWRWKSRRRGRPPLPRNVRELVRKMARENPVWGQEGIADELKLKLGIT